AFNPWMGGQPQQQSNIKPWAYNPVIVQEGKLFTLPLEGKNLLIYDAGSGAEVKRIGMDDLAHEMVKDMTSPGPDKLDTLIGVIGEKVLLAGERSVACIDR